MTIKGRLTANIVINFLLIIAIVASALIGIGFVKNKISLLTEKSTPYQTRTMDFQRALQATVADLLKVNNSASEQDLATNRTQAENSLHEVQTAQEELARLSGSKSAVSEEMAAIAHDVISATTDRLAAEKQNREAWQAARAKIAETSNRLKELDARIRTLQGSSSNRFRTSRESASTMNRNLRDIETVSRSFKDLQLVLQEINNAQDKKSVLLNKGKITMALNALQQNEYVKQKSSLSTDIKSLAARIDEQVKHKASLAGTANDELKTKYDILRKAIQEDLAAISLIIEQDAASLQEQAKTETQQQGEVFAQYTASNEVLAGTSILLTQSSLVEGLASRLISASSAGEADNSVTDLARTFERITASQTQLTVPLRKLNARKELNTLSAVQTTLLAVRENLLGSQGIAAKVRTRLQVEQKVLAAMDRLKALVTRQAAAGREAIDTAKTDQATAIVSVNHMVRFSRILLISIGFAGLVIGLLIGIFLYRAITVPLRDCIRVVDKIADGNLDVEIVTGRKDELGTLLAAVGRMSDNLKDIVRQVKGSARSVAEESDQLDITAGQMATGAEQVANQAATVATASEEMAATSADIASNCLSAAESSNRACDAAESGARAVEKTVLGMSKISERVQKTAIAVESLGSRSEQIGEIVKTIKDIADQTNLLALNAAIEAARAGDQGRGFAVVADEVRALAERTTGATDEISMMISSIQGETRDAVLAMNEGVREVESGSADAARSGSVLREILDLVQSVNMQVNQIATAAEEQTATTGEISANIHQITDVVQQTANGAQQSAAAARELTGLAAELQQVVGRFRLNG